MHVFGLYFGWPAGAVYSNLLASAICGVLVYLRMRAKLAKSHAGLHAQAERHHAEATAQRQAHQNELKHQAERHHLQALDRLEAHHEALKAHVTAATKARGKT